MQFNRLSPSFSRYKVLKLIQMLEHRKNRHIQRKFGIWCLDKKIRDDSRSGTRCQGIPNGKWAVKGRVQRCAIRMQWFLMDKWSARCLGLEGGHSRRESETPKRPLKMPPTSWHSATNPLTLMVWLSFWRYVCLYLAISMAQSIIRDRLIFFCRSFWRVYKKLPLPLWRVAKYFEGNMKGWTPK